ncbi:hypothetical protein BDQ17DRAFT_1464132 [Cyathus striatus]|nr:hypothetical protein BDQ17DRAFT_1464132 [Cyathus striatus]
MSFNNYDLVQSIGQSLDSNSSVINSPVARKPVVSELCLPERLPTSAFMQREAEYLAPKTFLKQFHRSNSPQSPEEDITREDTASEIGTEPLSARRTSVSSTSSIKSAIKSFLRSPIQATATSGWRDPEPFQIFRAIEEHDVTFLMEIRDKAFHLLLRKSGGATPLVYAMRLGRKDIAIILIGAFSRWVNNLEDEDVKKQTTQIYLKALRTNLKLAIDEGLATAQSDLIASFMQTLIMSEGDKWVLSQVSTISRALNAGTASRPVQLAGEVVRSFATKRLGKAGLIASFEDYVANATADLLLMSAWSIVLQTVSGELIPTYYFARDDRVYKAFADRLHLHRSEVEKTCNRRLKWQLRILEAGLQGRTITFRRKVELLAVELDDSEGI